MKKKKKVFTSPDFKVFYAQIRQVTAKKKIQFTSAVGHLMSP